MIKSSQLLFETKNKFINLRACKDNFVLERTEGFKSFSVFVLHFKWHSKDQIKAV